MDPCPILRSYEWSYNPYKWLYKWVTGVMLGGKSPFLIGDASWKWLEFSIVMLVFPGCVQLRSRLSKNTGTHFWLPQKWQCQRFASFMWSLQRKHMDHVRGIPHLTVLHEITSRHFKLMMSCNLRHNNHINNGYESYYGFTLKANNWCWLLLIAHIWFT